MCVCVCVCVFQGGSLGKGTGVRDFSDVDLLVVLNNYKSVEALSENLPQILRDFEDYLVSNVKKNIGDKAMIAIVQRTPYTLQFRMTCDMDSTWFDVDLLPIVDVWSTCKLPQMELFITMELCVSYLNGNSLK